MPPPDSHEPLPPDADVRAADRAVQASAAPRGRAAVIPLRPRPLRGDSHADAVAGRGGAARTRARILVIDDNATVLSLFGKILMGDPAAPDAELEALESSVFGMHQPAPPEQPRFEVELVRSGEAGCDIAALAAASGRPYAVAFVDMRMPGGWDGLATIEALWRIDRQLQVVICSAYSDHSWDDMTARLGRSDRLFVLRKPFDKIEVLQLACALTDKWRLQQERQARLCELEERVAERTRHLQAALSEREAYERELYHLATHDALTGLPNRKLLDERIAEAIAPAQRGGQRMALMFLDLDRFKYINDSLGHRAGDGLLKAVAGRLLAAVRKTDTVARLGGDEFVIVLPLLERPQDAGNVAQAVRAALARPFELDGHTLHVSASIGVSVFPEDGDDGEKLLKHADAAMFRAKAGKADGIAFFAREMALQVQQRTELEAALRRALPEGQLELHYQPQVNLRSGEVVGVEALLRWRRPESGLVPPDQFIPLAEETGLMLIDDDAAVLAALTRVLHADGYRILSTVSVREAFELLAIHPVGVIVCDGRMPELSGVEFFGRVKELYPETVRIMLSAYMESCLIAGAINQGEVYKFLAKPWDVGKLRACIAEAFGRHEHGAAAAWEAGRRGAEGRRCGKAAVWPSSPR